MKSSAKKRYRVIDRDNPAFRRDFIFRRYEDSGCELFLRLRERFRLDEVVRGEADEMRRILALRHWLRSHVVVDFSHPAAPTEDLVAMLEAAPSGGGYHCSHFMVAQDAIMNAFGHVSRRLGVGPGGDVNSYAASGHHGVNEIWSNDLCKWFVSDAEEDCHFEKGGVPLSALEIRDEFLRDGAAAVRVVKGPERRPMRPKLLFSPHAYAWISWDLRGERRPEELLSDVLAVYEDDRFRQLTWNRWTEGADGVRPHYAYAAGCFLRIRDRDWIEWTPNVLDVRARVSGSTARVRIFSCTPNLREYQMREGRGGWERVEPEFSLRLGQRRHEYVLRSMNAAGVAGPEFSLRFERS